MAELEWHAASESDWRSPLVLAAANAGACAITCVGAHAWRHLVVFIIFDGKVSVFFYWAGRSACSGSWATAAAAAGRARAPRRAASVLTLQSLALPARLLSPLIWRSVGLPVAARDAAFGWRLIKRNRRRSHRAGCTGSFPTSEVKRYRSRSVLGWEAAWEVPRLLSAFASFAQLKLRNPTKPDLPETHARARSTKRRQLKGWAWRCRGNRHTSEQASLSGCARAPAYIYTLESLRAHGAMAQRQRV